MNITQATNDAQLRQIESLYERSFPPCERKPFPLIREKQAQGSVDILYLEEDGNFRGLAITMKDGDLILLDYFAIAADSHGMGYGSAALQKLFGYYPGKRFFLEIESTKEDADNKEQRLHRKHFYLKNRMTELGIEASVFGTNMELLGHETSLTAREYQDVYRNVYGQAAAQHIQISTLLI